jgi:hypothetical protein
MLVVMGTMTTGCWVEGDDGIPPPPPGTSPWDAGGSRPDSGTLEDGGTSVEPCIAQQVVDCACGDGQTGKKICNATGTGYGVCSCGQVGTCSSSRMAPFGTVQTSQTQLDYNGGKVLASSTHKVDVDVIEDGCVSRMELTLSLSQGQCPLKLVFTGKNGTYGGLSEVRFTADSTCPGFLDAAEGTYTSPAHFTPWSYLGPQVVPQRMAASVCMAPVRLGFPNKPFRLYRSSPSPAELTVNLHGLELHGDLFSKGDPNVRCFDASACGPGLRDGGDGWCVEQDKCSPGYHEGGNGRCVASTVCAEGYHLSPSGTCTPWKTLPQPPGARNRASSVVAGDSLYLVGGQDTGNLLNEVWFASVLGDGTLGEWKATASLPSGRADAPVAASGDYLYAVGGLASGCSGSCTVYAKDVFKAPLQADGTLGAWSPAGSLPENLGGHAVVVHGGNLYVLVGWSAYASWQRAVLLAPLQADGNLGAWKRGPDLPAAVNGHDAVVVGSTLYVAGGFLGTSGGKQLYRATLAADGTPGAWTSSSLPYGCGDHTVETHGGYLYLLAGKCEVAYGTYRGDFIQFAPVLASGALGSWTVKPLLEPERVHHQSAVHGDFVYLLGGDSLSATPAPHLQMARFRPSGGGLAPE